MSTTYHNLGQFRVMRVEDTPVRNRSALDTPEQVAAYWREEVASAPWFDPLKEHLVAVVTTSRGTPLGWNLVSMGTLTSAPFHLREVLRPVLVAGGAGFILMHNHPSGDPSPSDADIESTKRVLAAAELFQVKLLDHVIVGNNSHFSFECSGMLHRDERC